MRRTNRQALITDLNPLSPVSETYRMLRTNLQFLIQEQELEVLSVVSAHPGEGKTTTLVNLAITFANENRKVILIDGDLRRSTLHHIFHKNNDFGLSSVLRKYQELSNAIHSTHINNLDLITAGPVPINPSELLGSQGMKDVMEQLKARYDLILLDSPPLLVADSKIIARQSDGVMMIVRSGKTKRDDAWKVKTQLENVNVKLLGVVLNNHKLKNNNDYYNYYRDNKNL
ncbi:CpsD/CapB family tyrosine-protein kinase [Paenibacillus sp. N1-5-1-14]|uniref:CpsD/CapB family tyrosine-protein kinase n=1 Tax=Paenibacillus radicibacter TaxID=2972488 RepID=UPI002159805E|nr:CpsD/CapB family tyrosine-protein kinase [Paenibacillus radicibacter]MCR8641094.1 CpsD/CapB family tyrosine-protein kinase [Paenibacillus radicibacter]